MRWAWTARQIISDGLVCDAEGVAYTLAPSAESVGYREIFIDTTGAQAYRAAMMDPGDDGPGVWTEGRVVLIARVPRGWVETRLIEEDEACRIAQALDHAGIPVTGIEWEYVAQSLEQNAKTDAGLDTSLIRITLDLVE